MWSKARSHPALTDWFNTEVRAGRIVTCEVVVLEILRSARNTAGFDQQTDMLEVLDRTPGGRAEFERARSVQSLLARSGQHRGVPPADLLIAASAESHGVAVLHYDHDFDLIAEVTGQPTRWVLPAGTLTKGSTLAG